MITLWLLACGGGNTVDTGDTGGTPVTATDAWQPAPGTSWQWQLTGTLDTSLDVVMYDVDLFDAPDAKLEQLRTDGRVVVCYFSAGSYEDWRDDAAEFPADAVGDPLDEWDGEWWVDHRDATVRTIMAARLDLAAARGCDGVEPDNVDGYANDNGLDLTASDQLDYNRWLADEAHSRGLSVGLKNDLDQVASLVGRFDWALNEECAAYDECGVLSAFTDTGKAAFHVEYVDRWSQAEDKAARVCDVGPSLDTLIKTWDLGSEFLACP